MVRQATTGAGQPVEVRACADAAQAIRRAAVDVGMCDRYGLGFGLARIAAQLEETADVIAADLSRPRCPVPAGPVVPGLRLVLD